jgi:selenophosphate synthase
LTTDPQTSGGLLIGLAASEVDGFMKEARLTDQPAWVIGEVIGGNSIELIN